MSDLVMILTGAISLVTIILLALLVWRGRSSDDKAARPRAVPIDRAEGGPAGIRRQRRNVRNRMGAGRALDDDDDEEEETVLEDLIAMPEGKIGAKKRKKLEMKAEKRAQRERELEDREERRQKQAMEEERKKLEQKRDKELEAEREAEERRLKEEKEKQELEEYLKMKEAFSVEGEGFDVEEQAENTLQQFIEHIKTEKVVILEDLAARFSLKTQDCIDRVQALLADETLVGVIDDRGKFIYITRKELEEVAHFIRQRGRVSISELVDSSNSLINLTAAA